MHPNSCTDTFSPQTATPLAFATPQPQSVAFLLDYSGPDGFPQQLAQQLRAVVVLDHHKTAAAQLADTASHPPNLHVHMDMGRSGATIARDFFAPPGISEQLQHIFR